MFIPQVDIVGGFSMYSSPEQLQREGTLDLAVKYSKHPPALWVHTKVNKYLLCDCNITVWMCCHSFLSIETTFLINNLYMTATLFYGCVVVFCLYNPPFITMYYLTDPSEICTLIFGIQFKFRFIFYIFFSISKQEA